MRSWEKSIVSEVFKLVRILQIVNVMDRAGLETMLMNYYRNIDRSKIQFDFLTHRDTPGAYEKEIVSLGGNIYRAPRLYPQNYEKYFAFMKSFFEEHKEYKIVHSHIDSMSAFPLLAAKRAEIPYRISHSHSSRFDMDFKLPIKYLARLTVPYVANIYCACGNKAAEFMYGSRTTKIIHNAIDLKQFQYNEETRNEARKKLGIDRQLVIGHVGRYYYVKNQEFLLDIVKIIKKEYSDVQLLLVGKGQDESMLREKTARLGLTNNVHFLVDRADVCDLYQAMDVFVMPSLFEGLPVVGVEAQANGLPCLFSDNISSEVVITKQANTMSLKESPQAWANRILSLRRDKNLNVQGVMRAQGYDIKLEAEKLMKWYLNLAKN